MYLQGSWTCTHPSQWRTELNYVWWVGFAPIKAGKQRWSFSIFFLSILTLIFLTLWLLLYLMWSWTPYILASSLTNHFAACLLTSLLSFHSHNSVDSWFRCRGSSATLFEFLKRREWLGARSLWRGKEENLFFSGANRRSCLYDSIVSSWSSCVQSRRGKEKFSPQPHANVLRLKLAK